MRLELLDYNEKRDTSVWTDPRHYYKIKFLDMPERFEDPSIERLSFKPTYPAIPQVNLLNGQILIDLDREAISCLSVKFANEIATDIEYATRLGEYVRVHYDELWHGIQPEEEL